MARIRSLHPGLFTDENYAVLSFPARELLKGLWVDSDDNGIFEWKPLSLKMRIFPADNVDVVALLAELETAWVRRFEVAGRVYGACKNFCKYQRPKKPKTVHPLPEAIKPYVRHGYKARASEHGDDDADDVPQKSESVPHQFPTDTEKSGQMEEGGGKMEDGRGNSELRSAAEIEKQVFDVGKLLLGEKSGGFIAKLRAKIGDDGKTLQLLALAGEKSSPREFLGACLREAKPPSWPHPDSHGRLSGFVDGKTLFAIGRDVVGPDSDQFVRDLVGAVGGQTTKAAEVLLWRKEKPPDWWEKIVSAVRCGEAINAPSDIYPRHAYQ